MISTFLAFCPEGPSSVRHVQVTPPFSGDGNRLRELMSVFRGTQLVSNGQSQPSGWASGPDSSVHVRHKRGQMQHKEPKHKT